MSKKAMKLALEALEPLVRRAAPYGELDWLNGCKAISALREALAEQPAQQEPVTDRENAIIRFALHQFMSNAYSHMDAAAQDKDGRRYALDAVERFAKDAKDAEALLSRLQFKAPQPAQQQEPPTVAELLCVCGAEWEWRNRDWELVATPPAQRKPLTDEQREEIAKGWRGRNWTVGDIIDATEAAHGIKGDA